MSSVDPEAVERVKRHLEKQRTHDVVEERIRPTVVKRRAIAKPDGGPASVPTPSTSSPELTDVASRRDLSQLVPERVSSPRLDTDVMAKDRESTRMLALEAEAKKSPWSTIFNLVMFAVGGIGFTMSLFIAQLAFPSHALLDTAKLGILVGSATAMVVGLAYGLARARPTQRSATGNNGGSSSISRG